MKKMGKEDKYGLMGQFMRDGGQLIKQMVEVVSFMEMVMCMKVNG